MQKEQLFSLILIISIGLISITEEKLNVDKLGKGLGKAISSVKNLIKKNPTEPKILNPIISSPRGSNLNNDPSHLRKLFINQTQSVDGKEQNKSFFTKYLKVIVILAISSIAILIVIIIIKLCTGRQEQQIIEEKVSSSSSSDNSDQE